LNESITYRSEKIDKNINNEDTVAKREIIVHALRATATVATEKEKEQLRWLEQQLSI